MADRIDAADTPKCVLHIPKSGGTSIRESLEAVFPPGTVAPRLIDDSLVAAPDAIDRMPAKDRAQLALDGEIEALARYEVVCGHFSLQNLLRITPATNIITVLREPRARLLSTFLYFRLSQFAELRGERGRELLKGPSQSLEALLVAPQVTRMVDNVTCRLLLRGDGRLPEDRLVAADDVRSIADAALQRLDQLGDVVILEFDDVWGRLSTFFGTALGPRYSNVAGQNAIPDGALPIPESEMLEVLKLMDERSAADRLVYEEILARRCGDRSEARRKTDAVFADALVRFGDLTGANATKLHRLPENEQHVPHVEPLGYGAARPAGLGSLGRDSYVVEPYKIRAPHRVFIGDNVVVGERAFLSVVQTDLATEYDPELRIGDEVEIGPDLFVHCTGMVEIGNAVRIGPRVFIGDSGRDYENPSLQPGRLTFSPPLPVRIEEGAVVGAGAIILEGVTVGAGAQVVPGSVVTRDVPPGSTAAGNPARIRAAEGAGARG